MPAIDLVDAKLVISRAIDDPAKVLGYRLEPFPGEQSGFSSTCRRLEIYVKRDASLLLENISFFAKFRPEGSPVLEKALAHLSSYEKEVEFFEKIVPLMQRFAPFASAWAPRCYLAREDAIIQEYLQDYRINEALLFERDKLEAAARAQARMHAASYITERKLIAEQGKSFGTIAPTVCAEKIFTETAEMSIRDILLEWIGRVAEKLKRKCFDASVIGDRLKHVYDWLRLGKGKHRVVCHGDTWAFNMMFHKSDASRCLLVDFQVTRYAPRAFDLAQLVYLTTTREMRARSEAAAIDAYHHEFSECLRDNHCDPIASLAGLREEYEEARLAASFSAAVYYPFLFLGKEVLETFDSPDDLYTKFVYRRTNDAVYDLMERDEFYRSRLTEIALELVEQCCGKE